MQILLCDDDVDMLAAFRDSLHDLGHDVQTAGSGYDAIQLMERRRFDLVITDYWMKNGDGGMLANYCAAGRLSCLVMTSLELEYVRPYLPAGTSLVEKMQFHDVFTDK